MAGENQIDMSDPVAMAALFERMEAGDATVAEPDTQADASQAAKEAEAAAAAKAAADAEAEAQRVAAAQAEAAAAAKAAETTQAKDDSKSGTEDTTAATEPEGVATRDGKHIIPYSVLKSERDRAARAEAMLREAQEKLAAVEKAGNSGSNNGGNAPTNQQVADTAVEVSAEDMEALKEDFPTVYKTMQSVLAKAAAIEAKFKPVEDSVRNVEEDRRRTEAEVVQDAIDATPKLAHIRATDPEAFELAKSFDNTLKGQAAWAGKPLTERFAKVIELVEQTSGAISLPTQTPAPTPAPQKSAEELRLEAKALAEQAAKATNTHVPRSLSDFPAGEPAASDELQALQGMSSLQLADKFAGMSPEQMDAYLQNL